MATRDHSLDQLIIDAARTEFMEHGFQKTSLHQIAERAGITTGALYTRYRSKDALFCSLVSTVIEEITEKMTPTGEMYMDVLRERNAEKLLKAIQAEEQSYLDMLFQHYDECVLLFCKSAGSSLETKMNRMMEEKAHQTVEFFRSIAAREIDFDGVELIMSEQYTCYRQMLLRGYSKEKAISCMKTVDLFLEAGWKAIFDRLL